MDEYAGFAKWGLLWIIVGVAVWSLIKALRQPSEPLTNLIAPVEPDPVPKQPSSFEGLVFPGPSIVAHAGSTLEETFDSLRLKHPAEEQPSYYVSLTALVEEAYRQSFPRDLGIDSGNHNAFANSFIGSAEGNFERRFGPWKPDDDDDMRDEFADAVADSSLELDGMWFHYAQELDRDHQPGAWGRMLRRLHMSDGDDDSFDEAAAMIAGRIATLRA